MKRIIYFLDNLYAVKIKNKDNLYTNLICEIYYKSNRTSFYKEIFIDEKITYDNKNIVSVKKLNSIIKNIPFNLTRKELFDIYNNLNSTEMMLNCTDEIIEENLKKKGLFEQSKLYQKKKKI